MAVTHAEDPPGNPVPFEVGPFLPQAVPQRSAMWTPDRPAKFYLLNILADRTAIFGRQFQNPLADRIAVRRADVEPCRELFRAVNHPFSECVIFGTFLQGISEQAPLAKLRRATSVPAPSAASPNSPAAGGF